MEWRGERALGVRVRIREQPGKAGEAGKREEHRPAFLAGTVRRAGDYREFFLGEVLNFVNEDREARVGGRRDVADQLPGDAQAAASMRR